MLTAGKIKISKWGVIWIVVEGSKVVLLQLGGRKTQIIQRFSENPLFFEEGKTVRIYLEGIRTYLNGGRLPKIPFALHFGTPFQQRVWRAIRKIPFGKTKGYGWLADQIEKPGAYQAVGQACGANPLPLLIPCHRVVGSGRRLGGFSPGLGWKKRLLRLEGHRLDETGRTGLE